MYVNTNGNTCFDAWAQHKMNSPKQSNKKITENYAQLINLTTKQWISSKFNGNMHTQKRNKYTNIKLRYIQKERERKNKQGKTV